MRLAEHRQDNSTWMARIMPDPDGCLLKIRLAAGGNIDEGLRVAVDQREPAALHLDHDPVALFEGVGDLVNIKGDLSRSVGNEGLGFFVAVAKFATKDLGADKALVAGGSRIRH